MTVLLLAVTAGAGFYLYTKDYYHAKTQECPPGEETEDYLVYGDKESPCGIIFYPGAKVEERAYGQILSRLSENGICCVAVKMPYHLAVLRKDAAKQVIEEIPGVKRWYIGGHSLGGAMAADFAAEQGQDFGGVILLAAYPTKEMGSIPVLSVYGDRDGVLNRKKYRESLDYAEDLTEHVIEGGNHAGFGDYGEQKGDNALEVPEEEQWQETVRIILDFLRETKGLKESCDQAYLFQAETERAEDPEWPIVVCTDFNIDIVFPMEDIYCVYTGEEYRYLTREGEELTRDTYTKAFPFNEGLACVCKDGKFGYIDLEGETALPFVYDDAEYFKDGFARIVKDSKQGIIDYTGRKIVKPEYIEIERVQSCFLAQKNEGYDVFDLEGNLLSEQEFTDAYIGAINDEKVVLHNQEQDTSGIICQGKVYAFDKNYSFREVIPEQKLCIAQENGAYGVIDFQGEAIIPFSYKDISYCKAGNVFIVQNEDNKTGVLDGSDFSFWRVPCSYDSIRSLDDGQEVLEVKIGEKYGLINLYGDILLPVSYDRIDVFENGAYWTRKGDVSRLYDKGGALLKQGSYSYIDYNDSCYEVHNNDEDKSATGYLNARGETVLPALDYCTHYNYTCPGTEILYDNDYVNVKDCCAIIQTRNVEKEELPDCLFYNNITPRAFPFWKFLKDGSFVADSRGDRNTVYFPEWDGYKTVYKFYDFSHTGSPILYASGSPYDSKETSGGFFALDGGEVVCLLSAFECSGTLGGDYLGLWYDKEEGKMLFGKSGYVGSLAQYDSYSEVYDYDGSGASFQKYSRLEKGGTAVDSEFYLDGEPVTLTEYLERTEYCEKRYKWISLPK